MGYLKLLLFDNHLIEETTKDQKDLMQRVLYEYQTISKPVQLSGLKVFPDIRADETQVYVLGEGSMYEMSRDSKEIKSMMVREPEKFKGLLATLQKTVEREELPVNENASKDLIPVCIHLDSSFQLETYPDYFLEQLKAYGNSLIDLDTTGPFNTIFFKPRAYNDQGVYVMSGNTMTEMTYGCSEEKDLLIKFPEFHKKMRDYMEKELKLLTPKPKVIRAPKADDSDQGKLF